MIVTDELAVHNPLVTVQRKVAVLPAVTVTVVAAALVVVIVPVPEAKLHTPVPGEPAPLTAKLPVTSLQTEVDPVALAVGWA